ncbi:MAG: hydroxymethylpyrimidine/phosphomethylpyrimidine kinase [Reichenbachiella sp.]
MDDSKNNLVLSIAGFDPCGGAGILADIQTMHQLEVQGMAIVTALTYQNEDDLWGIEWKDFDPIKSQIDALLADYQFNVIKIGIINGLELLDKLLKYLQRRLPNAKIVWDPILKSSSGFDFVQKIESDTFKRILNRVHLITPNRWEYEKISQSLGTEVWPCNVLKKGGHSDTNDTSDILIDEKGHETRIEGTRIEGKDKHGTGCVLSSAVSASLSKGSSLIEACTIAKDYTEKYIHSGSTKLGRHYEIK